MHYFGLKTLEFLIYLLNQDTQIGIKLDSFNPEIIDEVLEEISNNNLKEAFYFTLYNDTRKQLDKTKDLEYLLKKVHENSKSHFKNFIIVNLIREVIINTKNRVPISFVDFKKIKTIWQTRKVS